MGELRGITITPELHATLVAVLALPQCQPPASTTTTTTELESEECNDDNSNSNAAAVAAADDSMAGSRPTTTFISQFPRMTVDSATSILNAAVMASTQTTTTKKSELLTTETASTNQKNSTANTSNDNDNDNNNSKNSPSLETPSLLSLEGVIAAKFLIDHSVNTTTEDTASLQLLLHQFEKALRSCTLSFDFSCNSNITTNATSSINTTTRTAFAKRLERLRLHTEERSYSRLTTNIQHPAAHKSADDITVKSMTYAASVGLNMIVGPLAFGTFMYFFAGGVLDHFFLDDTTTTNYNNNNDNSSNHYSGHSGVGGVDVRRVIAGVLSGAFMLFVEMILFVIRSHELDASVRKKGKRAEYRANPFGYTQKSMARTYVGDDYNK